MEVIKRLAPGKNGTKRYVKRFGERLVCVRYRKDPQTCKRYTTVELIVDEQTLIQQPPRNKQMFPIAVENVYVRIDYHETELRRQAKLAGASWQPEQKRWKIRRREAERLELHGRIEEIGDVQ